MNRAIERPTIVRGGESESDADVRDQIRLLWSRRWFIAAVTLAFGVCATVVAFVSPKSYEASVLLQPVTNSSSGNGLGALSSITSGVGGLAALAGISVEGNAQRARAVAVLQSRALTEAFVQKNDLLPILFRKYWDAKRGTWKRVSAADAPTLWKANRLFENKIRKVTSDPKSDLVTLTITWRDPKLASDWANGLVEMTNEELRNEALQEADQDIAYLNAQAAKTNTVEVKEAIYSLMQTVLSREMVARGTKEYAFKVLDPAAPPELPSSPKKSLWILAGLVAGLLLGIFITFLNASWAGIE